MNYNKYIKRFTTGSVKWDLAEIIHKKRTILPMWVADMDFATAPEIVRAIKKRADHPIFGYTLQTREFNTAVVKWFDKMHKTDISTKSILAVPGIVAGISLILSSKVPENERIVIMPPVYYMFEKVITANEYTTLECPLILNSTTNRYFIDFELLEKHFKDGAKTLLFCSPHNPGGRVWEKSEINEVIALCKRYNVLLISDEIHCDLIMNDKPHVSAAGFDYENIVTLASPSKTFNLAGLHTGYLITGNHDIHKRLDTFADSTGLFGVNPLSQAALIAAYTHGKKWLAATKKYIKGNYEFLKHYLESKNSNFKVMELEATYLVWIQLENNKLSGYELRKFFIDRGLWIEEGEMFGKGGENHIRINIACPRSLLKKGLDILAVHMDSLFE